MSDGERKLWQTVLLFGVKEALELAKGMKPTSDRRRAFDWIRWGGSDFRKVCHLAGFDPDFIRSNFLAGRISLDRLLQQEASNGGAHDEERKRERSG